MFWYREDTKQEKEVKETYENKYTIEYSAKIDYESNGILIPIIEKINNCEAYSEELAIDEETNSLWVSIRFPLDDLSYMHDSDGWFRELFKAHSSVKGLIRRELINVNR